MPPHRIRLIAAVAVVTALVAATACGGGDDAPGTSAATKAAGTAAAEASPATQAATAATPAATKPAAATIPAGAPQIDQVNQIFSPTKLTVKAGDTVYFLNNDNAIHSVNVNGKNLLGAGGQMKKGEVFTWKAASAGTFQITCDFHPAMAATITVQ